MSGMKVHHLNGATMCPLGGASLVGPEGHMVCHCLLIETSQGLALVDTAIGTQDIEKPHKLGKVFNAVVRPKYSRDELIITQITKLGFSPKDVRHIVLTHLDLDHAGGLADFPDATVHVFAKEHHHAMHPDWREKERYRRHHWAHGPKWSIHDLGGEKWMGFEAVRQAEGLPPEILLVPLHGHTRGHCGIAVDLGDKWLLHAGDAYFHHGEMDAEPSCPFGLKVFQTAVEMDRAQRLQNQQRLRSFAQQGRDDVTVFCAHDAVEFRRMAGI